MDVSDAYLLVAAVLVLFAVIFFIARNEKVRRRLVCPRTGAGAEVELLRRFEGDKKPVRVDSCSLMPDPHEVDCEQDCIRK